MLFLACADDENEPGKTYDSRKTNSAYANPLGCITPGVGLPAALLEVRLEGVVSRYGDDTVTGENMTVVRVLTAEERCAEWTGVYVRENGIQLWFRNGQLHREEDLPAIYDHGDQAWYRDGLRHREGDLPAAIYATGGQRWWRDGQLRREGGPAVVSATDGTQEWYLNGVCTK